MCQDSIVDHTIAALKAAAKTNGYFLRAWPGTTPCFAVYEAGDSYLGCVTMREGVWHVISKGLARRERRLLQALVGGPAPWPSPGA